MSKYEVRDVVCDYGLYEDGELKLILNSRRIALKIKELCEEDCRIHRELNPIKDYPLREKDKEIERLEGALKAEERHNELTIECAKKAIDNARAEAVSEFADMVCEGRVSNDPVLIAVRCAEKEWKETEHDRPRTTG